MKYLAAPRLQFVCLIWTLTCELKNILYAKYTKNTTCNKSYHDIQINPCAAELFVSIFHSFEAGIANAISSFK